MSSSERYQEMDLGTEHEEGLIFTAIIIGVLLIPVMIVATVVPFIHMGYAAYKISQGVDYRYPFVADMIDRDRRNETL